MDFNWNLNRFLAIPAEELAVSMAQSSRLSELIRHFGSYVFKHSGIEAWDISWFQRSHRKKPDASWQTAEFRVSGTTQLSAAELLAGRRWIESDLSEQRFNPPGQFLTGSDGELHHVSVLGPDGRWLVLQMRQSALAAKEWYARWLAGSDSKVTPTVNPKVSPKVISPKVTSKASPENSILSLQTTMLTMAIQSFAGHARRLFELEEARTELYRDSLTGLFNNRYLELVLDMEVRRATRFGTRFCVLFVDIDSFKLVNDTHGHLTGSALLSDMGAVMKDAVRDVDIVARYGGDEFVLVLLGADPETGKSIAERVRERVEKHCFTSRSGKDIRVTASIGIAAFPENAKTREDLLRIADDTMYASKKSGKNCVTVFKSAPVVAGSGEGNAANIGDQSTL